MLHGEIKINGDVIGEWSAENLESYAGKGWTTYKCHVRGPRGNHYFAIGHRRIDGAGVLAANVIRKAAITLEGL